MSDKIAFISPYPIGISPSQRFRFEQYLSFLEQNNFETTCFPFLTEKEYLILYKPKKYFFKFWSILKGFIKRLLLLFQLKQYAIIFIHREASPIGPPFFEWYISKISKKKIIYDFDDAIWLKNTSQSNQLISTIKNTSKVASICKWSSLILCGNDFLVNYAKKYNNKVIHFPTTIDTLHLHNKTKIHFQKTPIVGWTGTHSTIKYLYELEKIIANLQKKYTFIFKIISNQDPLFNLINYEYLPWNKENEINDLLSFDIGLMPLSDDNWAKGKCGFKALQYMALGIPAVVSPVGVNNNIIENGENGYLAKTNNEWGEKLSLLINSHELRNQIGTEGRKTVISKYSIVANKDEFLTLIKELINA